MCKIVFHVIYIKMNFLALNIENFKTVETKLVLGKETSFWLVNVTVWLNADWV